MLQIVLEQPGRFVARQAADPRPAPGEVLLRVRRIGICGTDLHAFVGRQPFFEYPRVLGHELGAEVLESATPALKPGARAAVEPYLHCGRCGVCRAGRYNCCETLKCLGVHTDGGMCQLLCVPERLVHESDTLSFDQLALVETLGIGAHAVARAALAAEERVLVVGAGPIGLATAQFALEAGGHVRVLEPNPLRRAAAERFGATAIAEPDGTLFDVVFDATGSAAAMAGSLRHAAHGGRVVFVGLTLDPVPIDDPLLHRRELTILASRNSCHDFPRIMRLIDEGRIDTRPWITHRLNLKDVPERFAAIRESPGLLKAMIDVD